MLLLDQSESLARQNERLRDIATSLMKRVEQKNVDTGVAYAQFERAAVLEEKVRERTQDLERTLDLLQESNAHLEAANTQTEDARETLSEAIESISEGFALFGPDDRLVLHNSRFCRELPDVALQLQRRLSFKSYVKAISKSAYLALPEDMSTENWKSRRLDLHKESHVVFNLGLKSDLWLQISEHRTSRGGTVILQTDVTTLIRLEREEREKMRTDQARILQATLDHLNQGVCIFDREKSLVGWNRMMEQMLDLPAQETALGCGFRPLLAQLERQLLFDDRQDVEYLLDWASSTGTRHPIALEVRNRSGQVLSVFGQEMPDRGFVISLTDVTVERAAARALSQANERLEQRVEARTQELGLALAEAERANASKSRFFAAASHDLLQPLSAAKLFVSSLSDQLDEPELLGVIDKAQTSLSGVEQIIEALLDISKLDARRPSFNIQPVRLSDILDPLRDELTPVAEAKGLELRIIGSSMVLHSDPGYLRRIVQNLMSNAIRYTDSGKILVGARRENSAAWIEVWDTGRGIDEADQREIFHEFKRLNVKDAQMGLGLGLAIVERACQGLSHPLEVHSRVGMGSRFRFQVPINPDQSLASARSAQPRKKTGLSRPGEIVFLVENDKQLANALTMMIERWGGHVIHALSGEEALDLLAELGLTPDHFLIDYQLGDGMCGTDLSRRLLQGYAGVPIRLISADRGDGLKQACRDLGLECLPKPINQGDLLQFLNA